MENIFQKEIVTFVDRTIEDLYIRINPAMGRNFNKRCEKIGPGVFKVKVSVPKGELFYSFFDQANPDKPILDSNNLLRGITDWFSMYKVGMSSLQAVVYSPGPSFFSKLDDSNYEMKLITTENWIEQAELLLLSNGSVFKEIEFEIQFSAHGFVYFKTFLNDELLSQVDSYLFKICGKSTIYYFGKSKLLRKKITISDSYILNDPVQVDTMLAYPPDSIVYHCFVDSFCRFPITVPQDIAFIDWNERPDLDSYYGGNLPGIISKIEHFKELGVTHLYITPIFASSSNHRYDIDDFFKIDPILGTEKDFAELVQKCHEAGIKVILDIVLNHVGSNFWAFQEVLKNQENAKYKDWFLIHSFPIKVETFTTNYQCWWNKGYMPELNFANPEVREYLKKICKYWIERFRIDGWRIDVSIEMELDFLKELRSELQKFSNIIIIGENWRDASYFLNNNILNGITNYLYWWMAFVQYFCGNKMSLSRFTLFLMEIYYKYAHNHVLNSWNIIGSHDIPRFLSQIKNKDDLFMVIFLYIMLPGTPVVYNGDEIGMDGKEEIDSRASMNWSNDLKENMIFQWYKKLLNIFKQEKLLAYGHFAVKYCNDEEELLIFYRYLNDEGLYCIVNFSHERIIKDFSTFLKESEYHELIHNEKCYPGQFKLEPRECLILKKLDRVDYGKGG